MVSLKDIASDVGVSVPLVSKVLNNRLGSTGASKDTIARIRQSAKRLGYRKNQAAAALRTGRQNVIGVFLHWIGSDGSGLVESIIKGIIAGCHGRGIRQQICFFETVEDLEALAAAATPGEMDGLIVAGETRDAEAVMPTLLKIAAEGLPVVSAYGSITPHPDIPNAGSNELLLCRTGIEHLRAQGCRRIASLGPESFRAEAFRQVRQEMGLGEDVLNLCSCKDFDYESALTPLEGPFAHLLEDCDGVFAHSDQLAIAVLHHLVRKGIDVPGQIKVVGVDNSPYCPFSLVPLSSLCGEDFKRGEKAVEMLLAIKDGQRVDSCSIAPKLYARRSTAID